MENVIVYTTEYYWHWDLEGTGLSVWDYRAMMENFMKEAGMVWFATDDPEICAHPANCLMVRIGRKCPSAPRSNSIASVSGSDSWFNTYYERTRRKADEQHDGQSRVYRFSRCETV